MALRRIGGAARLHADAGAGHAGGVRLHLRQLRGRPDVRVARPADPLPLAMAIQRAAASAIPDVSARRRWLTEVGDFCRRRPLGAIGAAVVVINLLVGAGAELIAPYDPLAADSGAVRAAHCA